MHSMGACGWVGWGGGRGGRSSQSHMCSPSPPAPAHAVDQRTELEDVLGVIVRRCMGLPPAPPRRAADAAGTAGAAGAADAAAQHQGVDVPMEVDPGNFLSSFLLPSLSLLFLPFWIFLLRPLGVARCASSSAGRAMPLRAQRAKAAALSAKAAAVLLLGRMSGRE